MSTFSEKSWNSSDDYDDDNPTTTPPVVRRISTDLELPGGVITTHCVSTVIRPGSKQTHDPLQFVKIQSTELSKKAVEQIRLAEEVKITKEKIKEVEEEWQNNLLNWKSKRRKSRSSGNDEEDSAENQQRKIKTFSEILNEKAKSGHRIGYNLHKYIDIPDEIDENETEMIHEDKKEGESKEETCNLKDLTMTYEEQQAQLQKKREELNNKLQELQELEIQQKELEKHSKEVLEQGDSSYKVSPDLNLEKKQAKQGKGNDKFLPQDRGPTQTRADSPNDSKSSKCDDRKSVWSNLLQQSSTIDFPKGKNGTENCRTISNNDLSDESDSENDQTTNNSEVERSLEQMLSFQAKLSTFESLAKSDKGNQQIKPKYSRPKISQNKVGRSTDTAKAHVQNISSEESLHKKGISLHDPVRVEEAPSFNKRLQQTSSQKKETETRIFGEFSADRSPLFNQPVEQQVLQNQTVFQLKKDGKREINQLEVENDWLLHSQSQTTKCPVSLSDDNREVSWDQHNLVCDQEVEQISERMSQVSTKDETAAIFSVSSAMQDQSQSHLNELGLPCRDNYVTTYKDACYPTKHSVPKINREHIGNYGPPHHYVLKEHSRHDEAYYLNNDPNSHYSNLEQIDLVRKQMALQNQVPTSPQPAGNLNYIDHVASHPQYNPHLLSTAKTQLSNEGLDDVSANHYVQFQTSHPQQYTVNHGVSTRYQQLPSNQMPQSNHYANYFNVQQMGKSHSTPNVNSQALSYNINHWVIQEAELRRLHYPQGSNLPKNPITVSGNSDSSRFENHVYENSPYRNPNIPASHLLPMSMDSNTITDAKTQSISTQNKRQMLSVSGKKKCSNCGDELGRGCAAMVIEKLSLYYHINCFRCSVCHVQLGNGTCGTDVRVRNQKLHCQNCYSNDEAGLKFSRV